MSPELQPHKAVGWVHTHFMDDKNKILILAKVNFPKPPSWK
jgi:ligand-binding SRPBCC domain-containing protein